MMKHKLVLFIAGILFVANVAFGQCPPDSSLSLSSTITNVSCNAGSDGEIELRVERGTAPFTYSWSNGATTASILELTAGSYSVTATDALGCSASLTNLQVTQPGAFIYNVTIRNETCFGACDGALDFFLTGGTPPYFYLWKNAVTGDTLGTSEDINRLCSGIYGLSIVDANGCTGGIFYLIAAPAQFNITATITNVTCPEGSDGRIILTATGGTGTKTYIWSTGETSKNLLNKPAGTYSVTVTDVNSCTGINSFTITEPDSIEATANVTDNSCNSLDNASIDITVTGGTAPYTFNWSTGATTEDLNNLTPGQYCVTITDSKACESEQFCFDVTEPDSLQLSANITNVNCFGGNDGAIDITVSGGSQPYTFIWTGGFSTEDLTDLESGLYTVLVQDANGCEISATYFVRTENFIILSIGITEPLCTETDGSATVSISGGDAPYTINWSTGGTGATINDLAAGSYRVTVTDANGCTASKTADISNVGTPEVFGVVNNTICGGADIGSIDITIAGVFQFIWSNGSTSEDLFNLAVGAYSVSATDSSGCVSIATFSVNEDSGITLTETKTAPACGQADGSIAIAASGGTPPYTYSWSNGQTSATATDLSAGVYSVTVTDALGCAETKIMALEETGGPQININKTDISCNNPTGTLEVVITSGNAPFTITWSTRETTSIITGLDAGIYAVSVEDASGCSSLAFAVITPGQGVVIEAAKTELLCNGSSDGSIDVIIIAGTAPFTFNWSNGATTEDVSGIPAGTYTIAVTDSNGCVATTTIVVNEPEPIIISQTNSTQPTCVDDSSGTLTVAISGGTPPYSIEWSTGDTSLTLSGLAAGEYCAVATDALGCVSDTFCFTIQDPQPIVITPTITPVTCDGGSDGAIDITVSGGTPPYTFNWSTGTNTEDISGLSEGIYIVIVTDSNGCTETATFTISTQTVIVVSSGITQPQCGESNGSITVSASGGTAPYIFSWSNGQTGAMIDSIPAGAYTVSVTDVSGCSSTETIDVSDASSEVVISGTITNVVCGTPNSGSITITLSGGTGPYTVLWSNGQSSLTISGLSAGTYSVTVTDSAGCIAVQSFDVIEESGLTVTINATNAFCGEDNGSAIVSVTGGTAPYTYIWSNGATTDSLSGLAPGVYIVIATDSNGCTETASVTISNDNGPQFTIDVTDITCVNETGSLSVTNIVGNGPFTIQWSTGDTTATITALNVGTYSITVTSADSCETVQTAEINPPVAITLTASPTEPTCNGDSDGSIDVTVSGGLPPFTFAWSTGATDEDLTGLAAGVYSVTATDANGCTATTTINLEEPEEIIAAADTIIQPLCNGDSTGAINISVTGGIAPYTYNWSNGDSTQNLSNVPAGQYCVTVTDANGCTSDQTCFTIDEPDSLQIQPNITQPRCNGEDDGAITVTVTGGIPPYNFLWENGDTTDSRTDLVAGEYSITVTDSNGCVGEETFTVEEPDTLTVTISDTSNVTCNGANDGSITVSVSGGTAPYDYNWSTGDSTQNLNDLPPGDYSVTVTDVNGCIDSSDVITITEPDSLLITENIIQPNCTLPGIIDIIISGGTSPYDVLWSNGDTSTHFVSQDAGTYSVTVPDASGCTDSASFTLQEPPIMDVEINVRIPLVCAGDSIGELCASVTGVPGPHFYQWSTGDTTECITGLSTGFYSVTVSEGSGCSAYENNFLLTEPDSITITSLDIDPVSCFGEEDGSISITASGGTPPYTFQWSNGATGNFADNLPGGPVTVTATDANGCSNSATFNIPEPAPFSFINSQVVQVTCDTTSDGSISVIVSGGTPPYTYLWGDGFTGSVRDSLPEGSYSLLVLDANECSDTTTFVIDGPRCNTPPVAVDDTTKLFVCINESTDINVLLNDFDPDGDDLYVSAILGQPLHGTAAINTDQTITYTPATGFIGLDTFAYVVCETGIAPAFCDSAIVIVAVLPCRPNIQIPNGFSPNGDGTNDEFEIPGIEFFPNNELMLFNRWGNKVREYKGYKNEWTGTNADGDPLPDGTYYYVLNLNDGANTTYTGYVIIHR
ncbi:MAG: gliding motility-associated C-terminal domain-containing protein [Chitinophagales bacterium]|nr:gliding motility-associated C-terminal domain-containing protein [Chitinophagales bacterium]